MASEGLEGFERIASSSKEDFVLSADVLCLEFGGDGTPSKDTWRRTALVGGVVEPASSIGTLMVWNAVSTDQR